MKKALSIVLALVLCLSMSVMAFAEDVDSADPAAAPVAELKDEAEDVKAEVKEDVAAVEEKVAEVGEKVKSEFSELLNVANDFDGLKEILGNVDPAQLSDVLKTTADSINALSGGKLDLDGGLQGIKEALQDADLTAGMPAIADAFFAGLEKMGVDKDTLVEKLQNSKILNAGAKLYTYGAAPAPVNPKTGSTAAIAVFAVLSTAAAAAFVCGKKKED